MGCGILETDRQRRQSTGLGLGWGARGLAPGGPLHSTPSRSSTNYSALFVGTPRPSHLLILPSPGSHHVQSPVSGPKAQQKAATRAHLSWTLQPQGPRAFGAQPLANRELHLAQAMWGKHAAPAPSLSLSLGPDSGQVPPSTVPLLRPSSLSEVKSSSTIPRSSKACGGTRRVSVVPQLPACHTAGNRQAGEKEGEIQGKALVSTESCLHIPQSSNWLNSLAAGCQAPGVLTSPNPQGAWCAGPGLTGLVRATQRGHHLEGLGPSGKPTPPSARCAMKGVKHGVEMWQEQALCWDWSLSLQAAWVVVKDVVWAFHKPNAYCPIQSSQLII